MFKNISTDLSFLPLAVVIQVLIKESFSLDVSWKALSLNRWNGILRGYKLRYFETGSSSFTTIEIDPSTTFNIKLQLSTSRPIPWIFMILRFNL